MTDINMPDAGMAIEECPYLEAEPAGRRESAQCRLLRRILRAEDQEFSVVARDACEACCQTDFPNPQLYNHVIASFAHARALDIINRGGVAGCSIDHAQEVRTFAVSEIARTTLKPRRRKENNGKVSGRSSAARTKLHSCDVIVCGSDVSDRMIAAIENAFSQHDVRVTVHLIDNGSSTAAIQNHFPDEKPLLIHQGRAGDGPFQTLAQLLPHLRSRYVAFQDSCAVSSPHRLKRTIDLLDRHGSEVCTSSMVMTDGEVILPYQFDTDSGPLPWQSLVMRRTALIDIQQMHDTALDSGEAFVRQVVHDDRLTSQERRVLIDVDRHVDDVAEVAPASNVAARVASGCVQARTAVDVVLPFYNTIDFVEESLQSILDQTGVEVVVHLVDDASTIDTTPHLERWNRDPRIRVYRNSRNIGPYVSFNNASQFFETGFVAIQDADDISLPHRLHTAVTSLQNSNADIFGGAVEMFGDTRERAVTTKVTDAETSERSIPRFRYSRYPTVGQAAFVINGSAVMRTRAFTGLGGFADYGQTERNRCGLDSEFYMRAFYAGYHFFVSRDVVLKYRRHALSSTQNDETGWGTPRRNFARQRLLERIELYRQYDFDPRDFGGLDHYASLTEPVFQ